MQINQIKLQSNDYPGDLAEIFNPPKQLNVLGQLHPELMHIAIVGTRSASRYGRQIAFDLACELARAGAVIVSGLAAGIDTQAHEGALAAGGLTLAVQGRGLNDIFPAENRELGRRILMGGGAIMSQFSHKMPPFRYNFPQRNKVIAGLCKAVIVVESGPEGGAMITARDALECGRTVMAVPGNVTSPVSAGPNNLLAEGKATAIRNSSDVLNLLGLPEGIIPLVAPMGARSPHEAKVLDLLKGGITGTQDLIDATGFTAADFANIISLMEITGKVRNTGAGHWAARK